MESKKKFIPNPSLKLMDQMREVLRYHHYAYRTEQTYCDWIKRYLKFCEMKRHPREMAAPEVERWLSHLATDEKVPKFQALEVENLRWPHSLARCPRDAG